MRYWFALLLLSLLLLGGRADANNDFYNFINGAGSAGTLSGTELVPLTKGGTTTYQTTTGAIAGLAGSSITLGTSAAATNPQRSGQAGTGLFSPSTNTVGIATNGTAEVTIGTTGIAIGSTAVGSGMVLDATAGTSSLGLPTGTTSQRPGSPVTNMVRYNSTIVQPEIYTNNLTGNPAWQQLMAGETPMAVANNLIVSASSNLQHHRAKLAKVEQGTASETVLTIGDSTTFGVGSQGATTTNMPNLGWPSQLARVLFRAGIPANANGFIGGGSAAANYNFFQNDSRVTFGSSWTFGSNSTYDTLGGRLLTATTSTNAVCYTPTQNVDTFVIYYVGGSSTGGFGKFTWAVDGGGTTTFDTSGRSNVLAADVVSAGSLGNHQICVKWNLNGPVFIAGFGAYNSAVSNVNIINAGWPSGTSTQMTENGTTFAPLPAIASLAPDLTIIQIGVTSWFNSQESIATMKANISSLITEAQLSGDVVLVTAIPSQVTTCDSGTLPATATQYNYMNAVYQLSAQFNVPVIDMFGHFVNWTNANTLGEYFDCLHPNNIGYSDEATSIASYFLGVNYGSYPFNANAVFDYSTHTSGIDLPTGTTAQRPASPANGEIRYNSTVPQIEAWYSGAWNALGGGGGGSVTTTGSPASGNITKFSGGTSITNGDLSGDITTAGTLATTLATVNSNVGSFTNANITVNGKGLITAAANGGAITLGTAASATNPQRSGEATTGLYSLNSGEVDLAVVTTGIIDKWTSTGETITGTATANAFIPNSSTIPTDGLYLPATHISGIADNTHPVAEFSGVASAVDYLTITNAATANPATLQLTASGSDSNINISLFPKGTGGLTIGTTSISGLSIGTPIVTVTGSVIASASNGSAAIGLAAQNTSSSGFTVLDLYDNAGTKQGELAVGGTGTAFNYSYMQQFGNSPFVFYTNSNERMRVLGGGGLAIGTTSAGPGSPLLTVAGGINSTTTIKTGGYTVSTLPAGTVGMRAYVTDQTTACPSAGAALTGSGAVTCPVFYNGSAWVGD